MHRQSETKLVKQQCLPHMASQYGEIRPTSSWDLLASLGHPCKFQRVSRLSSITARHSSSGRQPSIAALNRGRHLHSAGRPSRWTLAHILVPHNFWWISVFILAFMTCICVYAMVRRWRRWCGDSEGYTVEENSSVFLLIWMYWLPSARVCGQ